jgi:hypothetical protein
VKAGADDRLIHWIGDGREHQLGLALTLSGSTGADAGAFKQGQNTYRTRRSSRPSPTRLLYRDAMRIPTRSRQQPMRRRQTRRGEGLCSAPGTPSLIGHYLASLEPLRPRAPRCSERAPGSLGVVGDAEGAEDAAGACTGSVRPKRLASAARPARAVCLLRNFSTAFVHPAVFAAAALSLRSICLLRSVSTAFPQALGAETPFQRLWVGVVITGK